MKIQPFIEELEGSKEFKEFEERYKDSFLVAGFFILDYETGQNVHQIDYYLPSEKKVAAFTLGQEEIVLQILQTMNEKVPEKLSLETNIDLDTIKGILEDEMKNRNITEEIRKIIAVIQTTEGKKVWNINCILTGMELLKAHIDDNSKTVLKMEKSSMMDYIKKMPSMGELQKSQGKSDGKNLDKQIEQLDKLKEELKKERVKIDKEKEDNQETQ